MSIAARLGHIASAITELLEDEARVRGFDARSQEMCTSLRMAKHAIMLEAQCVERIEAHQPVPATARLPAWLGDDAA
jgi:hypothetical protein